LTPEELRADLRTRYGPRYNLGEDVGFESGYGGPGHWDNRDRWRRSAVGVCLALRKLLLRGQDLPPDWRVLDLGCGRGILVEELRDRGLRAVGVDLGEDFRTRAGAVADACALPFVDGAFEVVVALDIVEHLPLELQPRVLAELGRVARHMILATVPSTPPHFRLGISAGPRNHYLCMDPAAWRAHFEAGGLETVAEGDALAELGPPFAWGPDNYPFALRGRTP